MQINKLFNQRQFNPTIIAIGLKIGGVIGRNWYNNHVEALKQARHKKRNLYQYGKNTSDKRQYDDEFKYNR